MMQNNDAIQEAMRLANSPAGKQLLQMLRSSGGEEMNRAMAMASSGDYEGAKALLNQMLQDPKARALLNQMGGNHGSDGR